MEHVNVSFDGTAIKVDRPSVTMHASDTILLHRNGGDTAPWRFKSADFKDDNPLQFTSFVNKKGSLLIIFDEFVEKPGENKTNNCYTITVTGDNGSCTSPDPVIVNDPGTGMNPVLRIVMWIISVFRRALAALRLGSAKRNQ